MANEPKIIASILTGSLSSIVKASSDGGEYLTLTHIRVTAGDRNTTVTAKLIDSSKSVTASLWNAFPLAAYESEDIYALALEPGDELKASSPGSGVGIVVQYQSTLTLIPGSGGGGFNPTAEPFAFIFEGYCTTNYNTSDSSEKYEFATDVSKCWVCLTNARSEFGFIGNTTMAVAVSGGDISEYYDFANNVYYDNDGQIANDKHIYATLTSLSTSALGDGIEKSNPLSFSNDINGYLAGGRGKNGDPAAVRAVLSSTYKFDFGSETFSATGSLGVARTQGAAAGNANIAIATCGYDVNFGTLASSEKFTYASETYSSAAALSIARDNLFGTSNQTDAIFGGGRSIEAKSSVEEYAFSTDSVVTTAALSVGRSYAQATSNVANGLILGGEARDLLRSVDKYDWATSTFSNGMDMSKARGYGGATSTAPGYL